jgi:hypothetical protein
VPALPCSRRCRRPAASPSSMARGRRQSFHDELRCDDIPRPCSRPTSTRQPMSTWTGLVPSLHRGAFLDSQVPPRLLHRVEEARSARASTASVAG